jgi:hypothetical protein
VISITIVDPRNRYRVLLYKIVDEILDGIATVRRDLVWTVGTHGHDQLEAFVSLVTDEVNEFQHFVFLPGNERFALEIFQAWARRYARSALEFAISADGDIDALVRDSENGAVTPH